MCYVVVRNVNKRGSLALQTEYGMELVALKKELVSRTNRRYMQVITISRPSAYGECEPYTFFEDEQEFIEASIKLSNS